MSSKNFAPHFLLRRCVHHEGWIGKLDSPLEVRLCHSEVVYHEVPTVLIFLRVSFGTGDTRANPRDSGTRQKQVRSKDDKRQAQRQEDVSSHPRHGSGVGHRSGRSSNVPASIPLNPTMPRPMVAVGMAGQFQQTGPMYVPQPVYVQPVYYPRGPSSSESSSAPVMMFVTDQSQSQQYQTQQQFQPQLPYQSQQSQQQYQPQYQQPQQQYQQPQYQQPQQQHYQQQQYQPQQQQYTRLYQHQIVESTTPGRRPRNTNPQQRR